MKRKFLVSSFVAVLLILALLLPLVIPGGAAVAGQAGFPKPRVTLWLTILHNNDGESDLVNLGTGLEDFGGAARFKTLVDRLKWDALHIPMRKNMPPAKRGVLMLSSGDNFLAGPEFNASLAKGLPFYDTIAMDLIDYDAVAIGNHDFDFGPDVLADFIEGYSINPPPYLSSNLIFSGEPRLQALKDSGRIASSTVVKFYGQKVGIIGATTPALSFISSPRNVEVLEDVAGAVNEQVALLTSQRVYNIILISHLQSIEEDLALAPMLDGVDIMIAGGGDEVLANPGDLLVPGDETRVYGSYPMWAADMDGTPGPIVTTSGSYAYVGKLVAGFDRVGNLLVLDEQSSGPVRVAGGSQRDAVPADPEVQALVVDPVVEYTASLAANVIGVSEVALNGVRSPGVRTMETNEGNLVADSMLWTATQLAGSFGVPVPDVALQNGGGIRNNSLIPAGNITELDTFSMLPFANFVSVVENISREQFKEILENAVSRVEFVDGRFAQIGGFSFVYDPAGTAQVLDLDNNIVTPGTRVLRAVLDDGTVLIDGGVVVPGDALTVATIDFLARGGDQYPFRGAPFTTLGVTYQLSLSNYIQDGLSGMITAADYPEGGEGRITTGTLP
jgi:2',3'-cyclic-nucleotide 2'-phosphodiesterase (5'-nucleotidase family)